MAISVTRKPGPAAPATFRYNWLKFGPFIAFLITLLVVGTVTLVVVPDLGAKFAALLLVPAFAWITWYQLSPLRLPGPLVTIDEHGLWDRRISRAPIPWNAVKRAYHKSSAIGFSVGHVYLELSDPDRCQRRRMIGIDNILRLRPQSARHCIVNPAPLTGTAEEILTAIRSFRPDVVTLAPTPLGPETSVGLAEATAYRGDSRALMVFRNRKRLAACLAMTLIATAIFGAFLFFGHRRWITAILFLVGLALIALWLLRELLVSKPRLVVDRSGITLRGFGSRTVPWEEVRDVKVSDWFIAVEEEWTVGTTTSGPIATFFSSRGPIISATMLSATKDEIRAAVAHFRAQAVSSEPSSSRR